MEEVNVELTPELQLRLKGYLGFDTRSTFKYVPEIFRQKNKDGSYIVPKKFWPVYELKAKNGVELAVMDDRASFVTYDVEEGERVERPRRGRYMVETLQRGVKGWKGHRMWNLSLVPFDKEKMTDPDTGFLKEEVFHTWKKPLMIDLVNAIDQHSQLTEEELMGLDY